MCISRNSHSHSSLLVTTEQKQVLLISHLIYLLWQWTEISGYKSKKIEPKVSKNVISLSPLEGTMVPFSVRICHPTPTHSSICALPLSFALSLTKNPISGQSGGISLWILHQPGIRSLKHTQTHACRNTSRQSQTCTEGHIYTNTPRYTNFSWHTFISSRQLAMEYITRLRRHLQSLSDAMSRNRRWQRF